MYASVDFSVTPRPMYTADGRKLPDVYTHPAELRDELQRELGQFPLFQFWGPTADIDSTRWIGRSALRVFEGQRPTLTLVYLPHLDYPLQKLGPNHPDALAEVRAIDTVCGELIARARADGARILVLSEYGMQQPPRHRRGGRGGASGRARVGTLPGPAPDWPARRHHG